MKTKSKYLIPVYFFILLFGFSSCLDDLLNKSLPIDGELQEILDDEDSDSLIYQVSLSRTSLSLNIGKTHKLSVTSKDKSSNTINDTYTWTTSDSKVATVSEGTVKGISKGTAIITATSKTNPSKYSSCTVTVSNSSNIYIVNSSFNLCLSNSCSS